MSNVTSLVDGIVNWTAANARWFSYLLPDAAEVMLYLAIAAYFAAQLSQHQA